MNYLIIGFLILLRVKIIKAVVILAVIKERVITEIVELSPTTYFIKMDMEI